MAVAGFTDIITHFIGYLHINLEPERDWHHFEGGGRHRSADLDNDHSANHGGPSNPEEIVAPNSAPVAFQPNFEIPNEVFAHVAKYGQNGLPTLAARGASSTIAPSRAHADPDLSYSSDDRVIYLSPGGQPDETVFDVHQANTMDSNDVFGADAGTNAPQLAASAADLERLTAMSDDLLPARTPPVGLIASHEMEAINTYDKALSSGSDAPEGQVLITGRYVDGQYEATDGKPDSITIPSAEVQDYTQGVHGMPLGINVDLGSNIVANGAALLDTSSAYLSTIIFGDYYHTNAIIQTNVVQDLDRIATTASGSIQDMSASADDHVSNISNFQTQPITSGVTFMPWGSNVTVHVSNGDYYDVNVVAQTNYLVDNDLYVGTPMVDHYVAILGQNQQINQLTMIHDGPAADLLIVLGNYHSANVIIQQNVLANNDSLSLTSSDAAGGGGSILADGNRVTNDASIADYGSHGFASVDSQITQLVKELMDDGDIQTPSLRGLLPGNGTDDVNVLIVTGDYYDLKVISQSNVVADNNTANLDVAKWSGDTPIALTSGNTILSNSAAIVTMGTISPTQFLGGAEYSSATLFQANLVDTSAPSSSASFHPFVTEAVAFLSADHETGSAQDSHGSAIQAATAHEAPSHQDVLNSLLH